MMAHRPADRRGGLRIYHSTRAMNNNARTLLSVQGYRRVLTRLFHLAQVACRKMNTSLDVLSPEIRARPHLQHAAESHLQVLHSTGLIGNH